MPTRLSLRQLIDRRPSGFRVAYYQRHYLWGQYREDGKDSATYLAQCLVEAYQSGRGYFLQGITVSGDYLVDGQQRVTFLVLMLRLLGHKSDFTLYYDNRPLAQDWIQRCDITDISDDIDEPSQDIYYFKRTLRAISSVLDISGINRSSFLSYLLDHLELLYIPVEPGDAEIPLYKMMNGTKAKMDDADIIKAEIIRLASDFMQPMSSERELHDMRLRYANEWDTMVRWWRQHDVSKYYEPLGDAGIDLLLKLCLRGESGDYTMPLTFSEFCIYMDQQPVEKYQAAKHFFGDIRRTFRRFYDAYTDTTTYNRIRAILLLQRRQDLYRFLYLYFIKCEIDADELQRYYKLSFLGMTTAEIYNKEPYSERFDYMLASLSMADVYHSDAKRDVFNLLLRLNIDEDIKLGRRFDFSVWGNRSLEHIFSKSKVWHTDHEGHIYDGNDNRLRVSRQQIERDSTFMPRSKIVNYDGTVLSEHCVGNLVLLYGENNATFGNTTFEQKKMLFLAPGDSTVFQSRNLLHTVCVFAGKTWDHMSIVENYNRTLKNLKLYYDVR